MTARSTVSMPRVGRAPERVRHAPRTESQVGKLSDQSSSRREQAPHPGGVTSDPAEMLLADMEIQATIKHFLDHPEMHLADAEVSAATNDSDKKTPTDAQARSSNSGVILTASENLDRLFEALEGNREVALRDTSRR